MWNSVRNTVNEFITKDLIKEKFILQIQENVKNKNLSIFKASQLIFDFFIKNKFYKVDFLLLLCFKIRL